MRVSVWTKLVITDALSTLFLLTVIVSLNTPINHVTSSLFEGAVIVHV